MASRLDNETLGTINRNGPENLIEAKDIEREAVVLSTQDYPAPRPRHMSTKAWICVFVSLISSIFLFALDNTIVADVQPKIIETLGDVDKLPWVSVSYPLGVIAFNLLLTNLYLLFDNKLLFIVGVVLFDAGSAICGAAPNMTALIFGRIICGLGGANLYIGAMNLISVLTSEAERPLYLSMVGLTWGTGTVLGPIIGGAFANSSATWRWGFYLNICVGAAVAPIYIFLLPSYNPGLSTSLSARLRSLDWVGAILNAGALTALVMAVSFGGGVYAWSSSQVIGLFSSSGALWILFILQQACALFTTKEQRLFPVKYLKSKQMTILFIQIVCAVCVVYIPLYYIPIYFQFARGDDAFQAGVRLLPFVFFEVTGVILSGALLNKVGYYFPWYLLGSILSLVGGVLLQRVTIDTIAGAIYGYTIIIGFGCGLYAQTSYAVAQLLTPPAEIPKTVAFIGYGQISGITIALTVAGSVFLNRATDSVAAILPDIPRQSVQQYITGTSGGFLDQFPEAVRQGVLTAIVRSISDVYWLIVAASGLSILLSLFMSWGKLGKKVTP
ncbi:major facilitator superfamily-domain-containing protein [Hypoxylon sp. FL1857]|nr:major facilitator superfamily-domain-containing protein [Hypoxylon sp. FL1857]